MCLGVMYPGKNDVCGVLPDLDWTFEMLAQVLSTGKRSVLLIDPTSDFCVLIIIKY